MESLTAVARGEKSTSKCIWRPPPSVRPQRRQGERVGAYKMAANFRHVLVRRVSALYIKKKKYHVPKRRGDRRNLADENRFYRFSKIIRPFYRALRPPTVSRKTLR